MKKFVIVMITLLVLFIFLMLNYLLWDKENLQKQSESDRVQQDYLRGQNITLQATIDEQKQAIKTISDEYEEAKRKIRDLERQLKEATTLNGSLNVQVDYKNGAIDNYKQFMAHTLREVAAEWFGDISSGNYEESYKALDSDYLLFGGHYPIDAYVSYISAIQSISFPQPTEEDGEQETEPRGKNEPDFEILHGRGGEYEIIATATVEASIADDQEANFRDMTDGVNRLQIAFRYNQDNRAWAIFSILEAHE
jgi:hypothetical protein